MAPSRPPRDAGCPGDGRHVLACCREADRERCLGSERLAATVAERERLARELHDSPAQTLAMLQLRLHSLQEHPDVAGHSALRAELAELAACAGEALREVREDIASLRDCCREERPLPDLFQALVDRFARVTGVRAHLSLDAPGATQLPPDAVAHLSRILSEALTNVRKHAVAATVSVRVEEHGDDIAVSIEDDGRGLAQRNAGEGYGLRVMAERAHLAGGLLEIGERPGGGTRVRVRVPNPRAEAGRVSA